MIKPGHRLSLLENGAEYFPALIAAMNAARHEIHLESYIYQADEAGQAVAQALIRAARRGVVARVLLDGFGSRSLPKSWLHELRNGGVEVLFYRPESGLFRWRRHRLRRMHRKLAVVDARVAFVGGINVLADLDGRGLSAPREDFAVRVEGPLVADIHAAARRLWRLLRWSMLGLRRSEDAWLKPDARKAGEQKAEFLARDNFRSRRSIERAYLKAIGQAREEVIIANAYFLPGRRFRQALARAAERGVKVVLIVQGHTDHRLYQAASRALYRFFLEHDMEVHEYRASELHAKAAVIDSRWATLGSSNIDPFSLLLAREANLVVHDPGFAGELRRRILQARDQGAHRIQRQAWRHIPLTWRFASWLAYGLVRGLIGLAGYARAYEGSPDAASRSRPAPP
jgi:cardiolipin synthase